MVVDPNPEVWLSFKVAGEGTGSQLALFWGRWVVANGSNLQTELGYKGKHVSHP